MTEGPYNPTWPQTIDEALKGLRFHCARLEELLEKYQVTGTFDETYVKRADKAVTVMKVGFKILKKAANKRRDTTRLTLIKND